MISWSHISLQVLFVQHKLVTSQRVSCHCVNCDFFHHFSDGIGQLMIQFNGRNICQVSVKIRQKSLWDHSKQKEAPRITISRTIYMTLSIFTSVSPYTLSVSNEIFSQTWLMFCLLESQSGSKRILFLSIDHFFWLPFLSCW